MSIPCQVAPCRRRKFPGGRLLWLAAMVGALLTAAGPARAEGDARAGVRVFRACAACHSLEPGRHMTGPSLAGIWGREAASIEGFTRYSPALAESDLTWTAETLDAWLADPAALVPGNRMIFRGVADARARADLIALLKSVGPEGPGAPAAAEERVLRAGELPDLKTVGPERQVTAISYCGDTYRVTTADGESQPYWEFNLRFKTDSTDTGPPKGTPVLLPASMMGDRAFVIFADPEEISALIEPKC